MGREVKEGDYDALLAVMNYLGKVRDRRAKTDTMFEPIKETIELLKTYDVEFPEEIYVQLQELPDAWNNVKKIAIAVRANCGLLKSRTVTSVIVPSVPSAPVNSARRL